MQYEYKILNIKIYKIILKKILPVVIPNPISRFINEIAFK